MPFILSLCLLLFSCACLQGRAARPESVVVVANERHKESRLLAQYYMEKRGIPQENLVLLKTTDGQIIDWAAYIEQIHNPLLEWLIERQWIDARLSELKDAEGRWRFAPAGHKIGYIVLCRGMPLRISPDDTRTPALTRRGWSHQLNTNRASVDSELSLIVRSETPINGVISNPLFGQLQPAEMPMQQVARVARLDGPSLLTAKALVDRALQAEERGLMGRAYLDKGGRHPRGDKWLDNIADKLRALGFEPRIEESKRTFQSAARFDAPALYFGWYARHVDGPFLNTGFHFPPGAIAVHIQSYSASTLRHSDRDWCGPFIARGATATLGNVSEPFLKLTHHLDRFVDTLTNGWQLGAAAYYALPSLSWQPVLIGDPLYRPFSKPLEAQLAAIEAAEETDYYAQYAILRKMYLLKRQGREEEALRWAEQGFAKSPGLALGLALADLYLSRGDQEKAIQTLKVAEYLDVFGTDDWIIIKQMADRLFEEFERDSALKIYKNVIESDSLPPPVQKAFLIAGGALAKVDGRLELSLPWEKQLQKLRNKD